MYLITCIYTNYKNAIYLQHCSVIGINLRNMSMVKKHTNTKVHPSFIERCFCVNN